MEVKSYNLSVCVCMYALWCVCEETPGMALISRRVRNTCRLLCGLQVWNLYVGYGWASWARTRFFPYLSALVPTA